MGSRVSARTDGSKTLSFQAATQAAFSDEHSQKRDETQQEQERRHLHHLSQCQSQAANAAVADDASVFNNDTLEALVTLAARYSDSASSVC